MVEELLDELAGALILLQNKHAHGLPSYSNMRGGRKKWLSRCTIGTSTCVMPFGLTNYRTMFQFLMNSVFLEHIHKFFIDDILVYNTKLQEHEDHLRTVLALLRSHKLLTKATKCSFAQPSIEYLRHVISQDDATNDTSKMSAMNAWPVPTTTVELCWLLGLTAYY